jgi:hypothetical protein
MTFLTSSANSWQRSITPPLSPPQCITHCQSIANRWSWFVGLIAIGSFSSALYPHPPLVALGTVAGSTLPPRKATAAAIAIWLANQAWGYGLRGYPQTIGSVMWGLLMGFAMVAMTGLAAWRPAFSRQSDSGHLSWTAIALGMNFLLFQGLITLFWTLLGGHGFTLTILGWLLNKEAAWAIGLTAAYFLFCKTRLGRS